MFSDDITPRLHRFFWKLWGKYLVREVNLGKEINTFPLWRSSLDSGMGLFFLRSKIKNAGGEGLHACSSFIFIYLYIFKFHTFPTFPTGQRLGFIFFPPFHNPWGGKWIMEAIYFFLTAAGSGLQCATLTARRSPFQPCFLWVFVLTVKDHQ